MASANELKDIFVGDYGVNITLTFKDEDGVVVDISSYTGSNKVYVSAPDGRKIVTCSASFSTDGTDGKLVFAFADGDLNRDGVWSGQAMLTTGSAEVRSRIFTINVKRRIGG